MTGLTILLSEEAVDDFLEKEGMEFGSVKITHFLLQRRGTDSGKPCAMLVFELPDGKKVLGKTTMALLEGAVRASKAACEGTN